FYYSYEMTRLRLARRGLTYYWRTNIAVVVGVATAVAVLAGALLVGDSVRGSLRDLVVQRLGRTDQVVLSPSFFRDALARDLLTDASFQKTFVDAAPLIVMRGMVTDQVTRRRAARVQVYGVDERFWRLQNAVSAGARMRPDGRDAVINQTLATEIGAKDE